MRLAYGQAPQLAYWWLDGYADFDDLQAPAVRRALDGFFRWHRSTQLAGYAALLDDAAGKMGSPLEASQVCQWTDEATHRLRAAFDQAVPQAAGLARELGPEQLSAIDAKYRENITEYREEFMEGTPAQRRARRLERTEERLGRLYGDFSREQAAQIDAWLQASPFDPQVSLTEREARQRDVTAVLEQVSQGKADQPTTEAALRTLAKRVERSPRPAYARYEETLRRYNCDFVSRVHGITDTTQRERAATRLRGWAQDLRSLAG